MTDQETERLQQLTYKTIRQAMGDELVVFQAATLNPMFAAIEELQKSVAMLVQGQAMVESKLADSMSNTEDDEPWRESLEGD